MAFSFERYAENLFMTGSETQVKWAKTLRQRKSREFDQLGLAGIGRIIRPVAKEEDFARTNCMDVPRVSGMLSTLVVICLANPQAGWWITHRDDKIETWIIPAYHNLILNWSLASPYVNL